MRRLSACALALALSVSMVLPAGAAGNTFSDVPQSHWAYAYVEDMARKGVVSGVGNGRFDPEGAVSTAQFAVMLTQAFCPKEVASAAEGAAWWTPYMDAAREAGYLTDTTAGWSYAGGGWDAAVVTAPMTRYDMAQAMWNTVVAEGMAQPTGEQREAAQSAIGDFASIPEDYESAVVAMYALGYLSGVNANGDFGGEGTMTRAQSCVVMSKLLGADESTEPETPEQPGETQQPEETQEPEQSQQAQPETTPVPDNGGSQTNNGIDVAAYEQEVFDLVNQIREENGLEPFVYNATLAQVARAHSQDMIDRNFFDHYNPDGESPFDRMTDAGIRWSMAAENIAGGQRTPEAVVTAWMNSPGHRANILGGCKELGVGLALGGSYGYYWTQCFATVR